MPARSPETSLDPAVAARLKRNADGLFPAIAQQYDTGEVLMLGWMDDEALHRTLTTGRCHLLQPQPPGVLGQGRHLGPRSARKSVALDCDGDTVLVKVDQVGAACHTGDRTCFDADSSLPPRFRRGRYRQPGRTPMTGDAQ